MNVVISRPSGPGAPLLTQGLRPVNTAELPQTRLYGEADLQPMEPLKQVSGPRLVGELLEAPGPLAREQIVRARLDDMGFEWMDHCTLSCAAGSTIAQACLITYANLAWLESYFRHDYRSIDPRQWGQSRTSLPLVWDLGDLEESLADHPAPARARQFIHDMRASGIHSGILLCIGSSAAQPGEQAVLSLLARAPDRRWIGDALLGQALTFGLSVHEFLSRYVRRPALQGRLDLPAVQQELLRLIAHGLTDKQIADRLQVSPHTVDYHLRRLRHRFAVRNRVQLVNAAGHLVTLA